MPDFVGDDTCAGLVLTSRLVEIDQDTHDVRGLENYTFLTRRIPGYKANIFGDFCGRFLTGFSNACLHINCKTTSR
jgi:hypothetical protein